MSRLMARWFVVLALGLSFAGCHGGADSSANEDFLCGTYCNKLKIKTVGPLSINTTWVPKEGFLRLVLAAPYKIDVQPATGVLVRQAASKNHIVTFQNEGFYSVRALSGTTVAAEIKVRVSDDGPTLNVTAPLPGAFVALGSNKSVAVAGALHDTLGQPYTATLNGAALSLSPTSSFQANLAGSFGVNFVLVDATDVAGNVFSFNRSFVAADNFVASSSAAASQNQAQVLVNPDALKTLVDTVQPLLPSIVKIPITSDPVSSFLGSDIYLDEVDLPGQPGFAGSLSLAVSPQPGVVHAVFTANGLTHANGRVHWLIGGTSGYTSTIQNLSVALDITFSSSNGTLQVSTSNINVTIPSLNIAIDHIPDWLVNLFKGVIISKFSSVLSDKLPPLVAALFTSLKGQIPVALPGLNGAVPMTVSYDVANVSPTAGGLVIGLLAGAKGNNSIYTSPGFPALATGTISPPTTGSLDVALDYNFFNQFAYELWNSGAFSLSLDETDPNIAAAIAGIAPLKTLNPIVDIEASLALPVVAQPGSGALHLSMGEVHATVFLATDYFQVTLDVNVAARADIAASVSGGKLGVAVSLKEIHVDLERHAFAGLETEAVEKFIEGMAPTLVQQLGAKLSGLPLPAFDLGPLGLAGVKVGVDSAVVTAAPTSLSIAGGIKVTTNGK
jgi:hypothetical protein